MVRYCYMCRIYSHQNEAEDLTFHRLPRKAPQRDIWVSLLGFDGDHKFPKYVDICSKHFDQKRDFVYSADKRRLLKFGAVPIPIHSAFNIERPLSLESTISSSPPSSGNKDQIEKGILSTNLPSQKIITTISDNVSLESSLARKRLKLVNNVDVLSHPGPSKKSPPFSIVGEEIAASQVFQNLTAGESLHYLNREGRDGVPAKKLDRKSYNSKLAVEQGSSAAQNVVEAARSDGSKPNKFHVAPNKEANSLEHNTVLENKEQNSLQKRFASLVYIPDEGYFLIENIKQVGTTQPIQSEEDAKYLPMPSLERVTMESLLSEPAKARQVNQPFEHVQCSVENAQPTIKLEPETEVKTLSRIRQPLQPPSSGDQTDRSPEYVPSSCLPSIEWKRGTHVNRLRMERQHSRKIFRKVPQIVCEDTKTVYAPTTVMDEQGQTTSFRPVQRKRYFGDITAHDFENPEMLEPVWDILSSTFMKQEELMNHLEKEHERIGLEMRSMKTLQTMLKEKKYLVDQQEVTLEADFHGDGKDTIYIKVIKEEPR